MRVKLEWKVILMSLNPSQQWMAEMEARVIQGWEETRGPKELKVKKEMVLSSGVIFHCFCTCYLCPHMHQIRCILNILINITKCPFKSKGLSLFKLEGVGVEEKRFLMPKNLQTPTWLYSCFSGPPFKHNTKIWQMKVSYIYWRRPPTLLMTRPPMFY